MPALTSAFPNGRLGLVNSGKTDPISDGVFPRQPQRSVCSVVYRLNEHAKVITALSTALSVEISGTCVRVLGGISGRLLSFLFWCHNATCHGHQALKIEPSLVIVCFF